MQHRTHGRTDAIDDRPGILFSAAFAAIDGGSLHGIQFWVSGAKEDGEYGYDQRAVCDVYDGDFAIYRFYRQRIREIVQRHTHAEHRDRRAGLSLRDGSGWPLLYWIDHSTGDANYLGLFSIPSQSGLDGFVGGPAPMMLVGTTPTAPEHFYSSALDNGT